MPRAENKTTPKIIGDMLYHESGGIVVGSAEWWQWLDLHSAFYYESPVGSFTARTEIRKGYPYWYAYRKQGHKLHNCYLGKSEQLTAARLSEVAQRLADMVQS